MQPESARLHVLFSDTPQGVPLGAWGAVSAHVVWRLGMALAHASKWMEDSVHSGHSVRKASKGV